MSFKQDSAFKVLFLSHNTGTHIHEEEKETCKNLRILIFNRQNCDAGKDSFTAAKASPVIYVVVVFLFVMAQKDQGVHTVIYVQDCKEGLHAACY